MTVTVVRLGGSPDFPLLVLGPSLGTSALTLWSTAAQDLGTDFHVVGWDLPGHGTNRAAVDGALSMAGLAVDVLAAVDELANGSAFHYAGVSVGGAVGLQLLLDAPHRVQSATLLGTAARIGTPESWHERMAAVRASGTPSLVSASVHRWFAPGFLDREPQRGSALLHALRDADDAAYVAACAALADFDVRERLGAIAVPVLAVAGERDSVAPPEGLAQIARGVRCGRLVVLPDVAHLAPAEAPAAVARLVREHARGSWRDEQTVADLRADGMAVRRQVLGDVHVDRAVAGATGLMRDFEDLVAGYAWGTIWTRPGLDRRSRSIVTITALVARGHHEELAMHLRAAVRNGLTVEEVTEVLLQCAIYCGVPDANAAFRVARRVFEEESG